MSVVMGIEAPKIVLVAAIARNSVIGCDGALPWHLPADLARFRALTLGKPVVMGRATYASIGRPLVGRRNVVLSRSMPATEGFEVARSVDEALTLLANEPDVCVIGGREVYRAFLPLAHRLEITHVEADVPGDVRLDGVPRSDFMLVREERRDKDANNAFAMRFCSYRRQSP